MPDDVWPLPESDRIRMSTFNGFGLQLKGFTRPDESGRYFATRWLVFLFLPIVPMDRFYLREGSSSEYYAGVYSETRTRYRIDGESRLRASEVLRTYLFWWLVVPAVVVLPSAVLLSRGQQISDALAPDAAWPVLLVVGLVLVLLAGGMFVAVTLALNYRKKWAPVRDVRWVKAPRSKFDELRDFDDFRGFE